MWQPSNLGLMGVPPNTGLTTKTFRKWLINICSWSRLLCTWTLLWRETHVYMETHQHQFANNPIEKLWRQDQNEQMKELRETGKIAKTLCFGMLKNKRIIKWMQCRFLFAERASDVWSKHLVIISMYHCQSHIICKQIHEKTENSMERGGRVMEWIIKHNKMQSKSMFNQDEHTHMRTREYVVRPDNTGRVP
jgi:hypothetical protein